MSKWKRRAEATEGEKAPAKAGPNFEIREGKDGRPYAMLSGRVVKGRARGGATVMLFSSKYEGNFGALMVSGWGGAAIPISDAEQIDVEGDTLIVKFPWLEIKAKGVTQEIIEFLNYIAELPKERGQPPEEKPARKPWKKPS